MFVLMKIKRLSMYKILHFDLKFALALGGAPLDAARKKIIGYNMRFRLSIWPNGHRQSQKYEFERRIDRTSKVAGLIFFLHHEFFIRSRKYMN